MKLEKVIITNFRCFKQPTEIDIDNFTAIVGRNDIGKSTVLQALDLFFNEGKGSVKFDKQDISARSDLTYYSIEAIFSQVPSKVVVDSTYETSLEDEYLLNEDGCLDIIKQYSNGTRFNNTFIRALHPANPSCSDLILKKSIELRHIIEDNSIRCDNKSTNSIMRKAIWQFYIADLDLQIKKIDVTIGEDTKRIWTKISTLLPLYSLFQSDRENTDGDKVVQDPLKAAVNEYLKDENIQEQLSNVATHIEERLKEVSKRTLAKLKEMDPSIADSLKPEIPAPSQLKWADVFKGVSITGDEDIPINKRGSGIKRLILLNFFRAEAEKKIQNSNDNSNIIYAIEEPETSQHYSNQIKLIKALLSLSEANNTQVLITTHSGIMVKELQFNNIRLIKNNENGVREVKHISKNALIYPSLNEVNYLAFDEITEEYHDELYGFIDNSNWLTEYEKGKKLIQYCKVVKDKRTKSTTEKTYNVTMTHYIRNIIHHPENTKNRKYTREELKQSIIDMRRFILTKRGEEQL